MSVEEKRGKIDTESKVLSVSRQCELFGLSRSAYYYQPVISYENIRLMSLIDTEFTAHPFYGKQGLKQYFKFYNEERLQQTFGYQTPSAMYHEMVVK